ncbi:hypothetical protein EST38_g12000 [Candolleomyces aberdarensis]|uniref:Uncharacterized protein n=1 Tax=Candolleomyces aberdarensis TaxID=2316362 RepID=A0A4Q2D3K2_9AGAR|nr:hypothetical protein EST38_g12000 [Candolleomyces aberdarensis]
MGRTKLYKTDEERKEAAQQRNREYYHSSTAAHNGQSTGPVWQQHIDFLASQCLKLRLNQDTKTYVCNVAKAFLAHRDPEQILRGCDQFNSLLTRAHRLENDILNQVGVGPLMASLQKIIADIREVVNCVEDVWGFAILGMDDFRDACINTLFMYQKL